MNILPRILIVAGLVAGGPSMMLADHVAVEAIAQQIADSSGGNAEDYLVYAASLAKTLGDFDPAKLREAMGEENYAKVVGGSTGSGEDVPDSLLSNPDYQAALADYGAAYETYAVAQHTLQQAEASVQVVLADEAGLKSDSVPGNYTAALISSLYQLRLAQVAVELADQAQQEAQAAVDAFLPQSEEEEDDSSEGETD